MTTTTLPARSTRSGPERPAGALLDHRPVVEVVLPVYNEQAVLAAHVRRLHDYLDSHLPYDFGIVIADNASTDATPTIARALAGELERVRAVILPRKGRGYALREVWSSSAADVLAYMDIDLSTDLAGFLPLVAPLVSGHSDIAIGSRLAPTAQVVRGAKREVISRCYNQILRLSLRARFSDAQCGFKAIRADAARRLLPRTVDDAWFFDTELLVLAQRDGLRLHEVPVDWVDDPDSRVAIVPTAIADLRGVWRMMTDRRSGAVRQLLTFAGIGVLSTILYLGLFALLRTGMPAQPANALALLVSAVANTAVNRRLTFGVRGRADAVRHQLQGLVVFLIALALSSGALLGLHLVLARPGRLVELAALVVANVAATLLRFLLLRTWVFRVRSTPSPTALTAAQKEIR